MINARALGRILGLLLPVSVAAPAMAYDAATTHAGLTERAALASRLHGTLVQRFGRPLGVFEPLTLRGSSFTAESWARLRLRLSALDPGEGYRPVGLDGGEARADALTWLVAGTVLASTPAERARNAYLDPATGQGLHDGGWARRFWRSFETTLGGGAGFRQWLGGTAFDFTGHSALEWLEAPDNDQSLPAFLTATEEAVVGATPAARDGATVRALLALGGVVALLEDVGDPAHVRNDFRAANAASTGFGAFDAVSAYERAVSARWARAGVPAPGPARERPTLRAFFTAPDGQGLADRTQRRFFSPGTVPAAVPIEARTTTADVLRVARASLRYPSPGVAALDLRRPGEIRYVKDDGRRVLAYVREDAQVRFFLDDQVYLDAADALLPEIGGYVVGFLDHLLRGQLEVTNVDGMAHVRVTGVATAGATVRVVAEDGNGVRRALPFEAGRDGALAVAVVPPGTRRVAAVVRGADGRGPFVVASELAWARP